jgi:hypothetical protein
VARNDEPELVRNLAEFDNGMRVKGALLYVVTVVDCWIHTVGLAATLVEEPTIPTEFGDLVDIVLADKAMGYLSHSPQDLAIKL